VSGENANTAAPGTTLVSICFYTIGDNKSVENSSGTGSDWFEKRAGTLASDPSYVFGETDIDSATKALQALPANVKITRLYFCGHSNPTGFILNESNWESLVDPASTDPNVSAHGSRDSGAFLTELVKHLASTDFQIGFLGCRAGNTLVPAIAKALSHKGLSGSVFGYTSYCYLGLEHPTGKDSDGNTVKLDYDSPGQEFTETINGVVWHKNQIAKPEKTVNVTP
jgi:hypothetical protein